MQIIQATEVEITWDDLNNLSERGPRIQQRSKGIHLSGVLRYIGLTTGMLKEIEDSEDVEVMPLRMFLGMAWEAMAVKLYPRIDWQPGENCLGGIYGTPDGTSFDVVDGQPQTIVEEFKFTAKSLNREIESEWMWLSQCKAYCKMESTQYCRLHICYYNGDYRKRKRPIYMRYLIKFTQAEIDNNWNMILASKDKAKPE